MKCIKYKRLSISTGLVRQGFEVKCPELETVINRCLASENPSLLGGKQRQTTPLEQLLFFISV